jgi:probable rRNA maturation factor
MVMGTEGASSVVVKKAVPGLSPRTLAKFLVRAGRVAKVSGRVHLLVTGNRELQSLNRRFRRKDEPTDVLSFPAPRRWGAELAGDVAVSAEMAAQSARRLGHSVEQEIQVLALHGVLHLAGFDHAHDQGEMLRMERRLRKKLGLPVGLIERANVRAKKGLISSVEKPSPRPVRTSRDRALRPSPRPVAHRSLRAKQ